MTRWRFSTWRPTPIPTTTPCATFRRRFLPELEQLFVQVLLLAREMKLLKLGTIALDGTKLKANASKHKALLYSHAKKLEAQFKTEVKALIQLAESADKQDAADGMDVPAEIARRETRLAAIAEAKARIEAMAEERDVNEQAAYQEKVARRDAQRTARQGPGQSHRSAVTHHASHWQEL